jgi:hypothetical protein
VDILYVAVEVGLGGELLSTLRTRELDVQVNALLVHLHVALLVRLVAAVLEVTAELEHLRPGLLLALPSLQVLDVMPSQFSVVIKSFLTFLATVFLSIIVDDFNVLVEVAVLLATERTGVLLTSHWDLVHGVLVGIENGLLVEDLVAQVTGVQALGLLHLVGPVLGLDVFV